MKKISVFFSFVSIFVLVMMLPAATAIAPLQSSAVGGGVFIMEHEDGLHKHLFSFSIKDPSDPKGTFHLVCMHDTELCMIIQSIEIISFEVEQVSGALSATFTGTARVMMHGEDWEDGWVFTVTVFDYDKTGKGNDYFILDLSNDEVHHMEGVLNAGNIVIKN